MDVIDMDMDYYEAMKYINRTGKFGSKLGLDRINRLLYYMGNPHHKLRVIHVAGTNGKGSVVSIISSILIEAGYKVGIYTSPYLQRFTERIKINNEEISKDDIARLINYIGPIVDKVISEGYDNPTEFEIITAIMFKYFSDKQVDFVALEVGLGGRLDSTNVINPLVSVITSISYDHLGILGNTLSQIAYEKAGIIKQNGIVVSYPQEEEALKVIEDVCKERNAKLILVSQYNTYISKYSHKGQTFNLSINDKSYVDLKTSLLGEYQILNIKTSIQAIEALKYRGIDIKDEYIYKGIENAKWPGRIEVMGENPKIVLDGAHNVQGMAELKKAILKYFKYDKIILVIGVLRDKEYEKMCSIIMPIADTVITTKPDSERALSSEELGGVANKYNDSVIISSSILDAYNTSIESAKEDDLIVFCGSLYMIGRVRDIIQKHML
jgi:dihydrofolate synthase/folylpolyglutamate synthase